MDDFLFLLLVVSVACFSNEISILLHAQFFAKLPDRCMFVVRFFLIGASLVIGIDEGRLLLLQVESFREIRG